MPPDGFVDVKAGSQLVTIGVSATLAESDFHRVITDPNLAITVPAGEWWHLRGPARGGPSKFTLRSDLHNRGKLTGDTDIWIDGQGQFDLHAHGGGVFDLRGTPKTCWVWWGDPVEGWQVGDRLMVSNTAVGVYGSGVQTTWGGSWANTVRPAGTEDVDLHGEIMRPEVINMVRSMRIDRITRLMIHEAGGVPAPQTLKHFSMSEPGVRDVLGMYPIHFHLVGDSSRGSLVEGVVIERSKMRGFVTHGSHGITLRDCAARHTFRESFWWDLPATLGPNGERQANDSTDTLWDHICVMGGSAKDSEPSTAVGTGIMLGGGPSLTNKIMDSAASGIYGGTNGSGILWPEGSAGSAWISERCISHNNARMGVHVWHNSRSFDHNIVDFRCYRNGMADINHGAYTNHYRYNGARVGKFALHALTGTADPPAPPLLIEDLICDLFEVKKHNVERLDPTVIRNSQIGRVVYLELFQKGSYLRWEDCGLAPVDFTLTSPSSASIIEIVRGGVVRHRWTKTTGWAA